MESDCPAAGRGRSAEERVKEIGAYASREEEKEEQSVEKVRKGTGDEYDYGVKNREGMSWQLKINEWYANV